MYGKNPQFARANADDVSEHQKILRFVGQNAHVHDHGFHLATHSLGTCASLLHIIIIINNIIIIIKPLLKIFNECRSLTVVGELNPY